MVGKCHSADLVGTSPRFVCTLSDTLNQGPLLPPRSADSGARRAARLHHRPSVHPTVTATRRLPTRAPRSRRRPADPTPPAPAGDQASMGEAGRDLLAVMRDEDDRRVGRIGSQVGEPHEQPLAAPRSSPANGSSRRISSGSLISARARSTCWRSPSEITPNGRSPTLPTPPAVRSTSAFPSPPAYTGSTMSREPRNVR